MQPIHLISPLRNPRNPTRRPRKPVAFTLVEILLVVAILGLLAAIVLPRFSGILQSVIESVANTNRSRMRAQVELYHQEHGQYPRVDNFVAQMTKKTNKDGEPPQEGQKVYGPYLDSVPNNPFTGTNSLGAGPAGSSDWYYNEDTGNIETNNVSDQLVNQSVSNMKSLIAALRSYASNNGSALPQSLDDLEGAYIPSAQYQSVMQNPLTRETPGYTYVKPADSLSEISDPGSTPVLYECVGGQINYKGLVGYADGKVQSAS